MSLVLVQGIASVASLFVLGKSLSMLSPRVSHYASFVASAAGIALFGVANSFSILILGTILISVGTSLIHLVKMNQLSRVAVSKSKLAGLYNLVGMAGRAHRGHFRWSDRRAFWAAGHVRCVDLGAADNRGVLSTIDLRSPDMKALRSVLILVLVATGLCRRGFADFTVGRGPYCVRKARPPSHLNKRIAWHISHPASPANASPLESQPLNSSAVPDLSLLHPAWRRTQVRRSINLCGVNECISRRFWPRYWRSALQGRLWRRTGSATPSWSSAG